MREALKTPELEIDVKALREDFPILSQQIRGKPLVYLDNAATTQKPRQVLEAMERFYAQENANVHRGVHTLSERATEVYEKARLTVARHLHASEQEIVFVRGTTEGINLVAHSFGARFVGAGDEIIVSELEHHSNIVPWQLLCQRTGAVLKVIRIDDRGNLDLAHFQSLLSPRTRLVSVTMVSNAIGTVTPAAEIIRLSHERDVPVLLDAAQAAPHFQLDVRALGCDFLVFSGHKLYGPTGIGILYGRKDLLEELPPFHGGGDMIRTVTFERTEYNELPYRLEAGTPNIAGAVGLAAALDYVNAIGLDRISQHERKLLVRLESAISEVAGTRVIGSPRERAGAVSFLLGDIHPHDIGTIVDRQGVAVRAGHHCAQPLMAKLGVPGTARASIALYNTPEEVDVLAAALRRAAEVFR